MMANLLRSVENNGFFITHLIRSEDYACMLGSYGRGMLSIGHMVGSLESNQLPVALSVSYGE